MKLQLNHKDVPTHSIKNKIILLCDGVTSPANIGGLFRICDAFGVKKLIFCNAEIKLDSNRILRTARNTIKNVPFEVSEESSIKEIQNFKNKGFQVIALEVTKNSASIKNFTTTSSTITVLIIGNERNGVSEEILKITDYNLHIPMSGANSSMNVVQATAIALYALT